MEGSPASVQTVRRTPRAFRQELVRPANDRIQGLRSAGSRRVHGRGL
jgi:hypothetical protein